MPSVFDLYKQYHASELSASQAFEMLYDELVKEKQFNKQLQDEINQLKEAKN